MLGSLLGLLAIFLAGRCILSFLPAGRPGEHALAAWPVTWATSQALGTIALGTQAHLFGVTDWLQLGPLLPWALLGAARLASLPGAMAPRHRVRHEPRTRAARFLVVAAALSLAGFSYSAIGSGTVALHCPLLTNLVSDPLRGAAGWIAVLILIDHGLKSARRAPLQRSVWVAIAALLASQLTAIDGSVEAALGAAFLIPWVRSADRRGGALSAIGWAALLPIESGNMRCASMGIAGLLTLAGWTAYLALREQKHRASDGAAVQATRSESVLLSTLILLSLVGFASGPAGIGFPWAELLPSAVLLVGLVWLRDERQPEL